MNITNIIEKIITIKYPLTEYQEFGIQYVYDLTIIPGLCYPIFLRNWIHGSFLIIRRKYKIYLNYCFLFAFLIIYYFNLIFIVIVMNNTIVLQIKMDETVHKPSKWFNVFQIIKSNFFFSIVQISVSITFLKCLGCFEMYHFLFLC